MIDERNKLTILHDDFSVFSDLSDNLADYIRDTEALTLNSVEDYLYIGFHKPFGVVYTEFTTPNINVNTMNAEYYDGTTWQPLTLNDESKGWTRSGFMFWDKADMKEVEINSVTKFFVRFRPSADHSSTNVRGLNLVFADDSTLKQEFFEIDNSNLYPAGEISHISSHVSARNHIVQKLRNEGNIKYNTTTGRENISYWDLIDIFEFRQASMFLALSKIFYTLSDSVEDTWYQRYAQYLARYEEMFSLAKLSIDLDDDGLLDDGEKLAQKKSVSWER